MKIDGLLGDGRDIWGDEKLSLDETELKKELGNVIFSMIRWCDDLGYSPEECIELARRAQLAYTQKNS